MTRDEAFEIFRETGESRIMIMTPSRGTRYWLDFDVVATTDLEKAYVYGRYVDYRANRKGSYKWFDLAQAKPVPVDQWKEKPLGRPPSESQLRALCSIALDPSSVQRIPKLVTQSLRRHGWVRLTGHFSLNKPPHDQVKATLTTQGQQMIRNFGATS